MAESVFEGVSYYLAEKNVHEPAEVCFDARNFQHNGPELVV